jgi:uncharacterized membrane protein
MSRSTAPHLQPRRDAARLSNELRTLSTPELKRRRWIVGLSMAGIAIGQLVGLYQMGMLRRLPDPPRDSRAGQLFDATRVNASPYAYKRLSTPDAFLMIGTYAATAILAAAGGANRSRTKPWLPIALAAKTVYDGVTTVKLGREEWQENKRLCEYCQVATAISLLSTLLALPEAWKAITGDKAESPQTSLWNDEGDETEARPAMLRDLRTVQDRATH